MSQLKTFSTLALSAAVAATAFMPATSIAADQPATTQSSQNGVSHQEVLQTKSQMKRKDHTINKFFHNAYAYAIFPTVGQGGALIGGAYGHGEVYKNSHHVGDTTITKFSFGAQLGGQSFSETIFFKDRGAFQRFKNGNFQFSDNASAVAIKTGATATNNYSNGVAIFTMANGGLMAGVNIGGQKFSYTPVSSSSGSNL